MPTRIENLRVKEAELTAEIEKIERVLRAENPDPVRCQRKLVPDCRKEAPIGGYHGDEVKVWVTFTNQHESGKRFVLCHRCSGFLLQSNGIKAQPGRYFFEELEKCHKGQLRAIREEIAFAEAKAQLSAENQEFLAGFVRAKVERDKPVTLDGTEPTKATLAEVARVKGKTNAQKKRERRQEERARAAGNGADPEPAAAELEIAGVPEGETAH